MLRFKNEKEACIAAFLGGPVALAYQKFDSKTQEDAHREYLDSIEPYRNSRSYEIPEEFVITKGLKQEEQQ